MNLGSSMFKTVLMIWYPDILFSTGKVQYGLVLEPCQGSCSW